jgi:hypothetical protein
LLFFAALARPNQVEGTVGTYAMQPCPERGASVEFMNLLVCPEESLLHQVLGVLFVSSHTESQAEDGVAVPLDQHTKGMLIPFAGLFRSR